VAAWSALVVPTSLLVGAAVATADDLETFLNLTRALNGISEMTNQTSRPSPSPHAAVPEILPDVTLVGVVIADERRLALVQRAGTNSGSPELLSVGSVVAGYRITDIREEQVTLEGQRGEQKILRLQTGGGAGRKTP
jgi:hypothetical protein